MTQLKISPTSAWLTVNRNCQLRCVWCYAKGTSYALNKDMSLDTAKKLALLISKMGIKVVRVIGGEPTLWSHLFEFNEFCHSLDLHTVLVTNAVNFGKDEFWEKYIKNPCSSAGFSIKAGNERQLTQVARVSSQVFEQIKKGITRYTNEFGTAGVSITYNKFYKHNLPQLVQLANDCNCTGVKIDFCHPPISKGHVNASFSVSDEETVEYIQKDYNKLHEITDGNLTFEMTIPFCFWPQNFIEKLKSRKQIISVCQLQKRSGLIFDTNGNLLMCNGLFDYPIGTYGKDFDNVYSFQSFINNKSILNHYDKINAYPSIDCKSCLSWSECSGGCPLGWAARESRDVSPIKNQF